MGRFGGVEQFEALEQLVAALLGSRARLAVQAPDHRQVLEPRQVLVDGGVLAREADPLAQLRRVLDDVEPGHPRAAGVGLQQRRQDPDDRRLAGAIRSEQAEHGPVRDLEVHADERAHRAVGLHEPADADRRVLGSVRLIGARLAIRARSVIGSDGGSCDTALNLASPRKESVERQALAYEGSG